MGLLGIGVVIGAVTTASSFAQRYQDWRIGPVVYQVFVDRFSPPTNPDQERRLIRPPKTMKNWSELPAPGKFIKSLGLWSHELEFWGGDLEGVRKHLDYISDFGADVLYLTPIHKALSNHRYDAEDFGKIDPLLGTQTNFDDLVRDVHSSNLKLILDGVFNHMGRNSDLFKDAISSPASKHRKWFYFDSPSGNEYRAWAGAANLPALRLENPEVQSYLWNGPHSIVRSYLNQGADGWRLDVAFELGPTALNGITKAAHETKPGSEVVGEIAGYPSNWFPEVDGVFNFFSLRVVEELLEGKSSGSRTAVILNHVASDAGIENLLRSWLLTDNHDTDRLASKVPRLDERKLIWAMQMTLPGSPVIYYGTELGMPGVGDPGCRAPMRWDLANDSNQNLSWLKKLIRIRRANPALRFGNFLAQDTDQLLAFVRTTDKILDTQLVVLNPTDRPIQETFPVRVGRIMSWGSFKDSLTGEMIRIVNGTATVAIPPRTVRIYSADSGFSHGYSPYHRIP